MKTYVFTNRVYPPVGGATGELLKDLAEGLVAQGSRVVVITSRGPADLMLPKRQTSNGVELIRVGTAPFTRVSHWRRALSYAALYPQFAWQVWRQGKVDAVVSMTDPPLQVAAVTFGSSKAKRKIHWAQDVYPELAEELGVIPRGGLVACVLRALASWALRKQDEVVVLGRCMRQRLVGRGLDAGKIEVIPNWSPVAAPTAEEVGAMRKKLGWENKFVALYSGNLGLAHDFDTIISAAKELAGCGVYIVFAGEGPRADALRRAAANLPHVDFLPSQPKSSLAAFLGAADVHLVSVGAGLEGLVVPSKAYGILAAGRPLIYIGSHDSEIGAILRESGAGAVVKNGDSAALAAELKKMAADAPVSSSGLSKEFGLPRALESWKEILKS